MKLFANQSPVLDEVVIRYKDWYVLVIEREDSLELNWARDVSALPPDIPVRDFLVAQQVGVNDETHGSLGVPPGEGNGGKLPPGRQG